MSDTEENLYLNQLLESENIPSLTDFARVYFMMQKNEAYQLLDFHKTIETELLRIVFGLSRKNLIVCMPPRFGKSELVIRIFLSWCFIFIPDCNFIVAANTLNLARSHVKAVRDAVMAGWYQDSFSQIGCAVIRSNAVGRPKEKATARSDFFETLQGGAVIGVGVDGLITGFGAGKKEDRFAGCIICDDLLKEQDFYSQSQRDKTYQWMKSTIESRRNSADTPIILVMQRLHEDDIVGRILAEESDRWNIIKIRAFNEITQKSEWEQAVSTQRLLDMKNSSAGIEQYVFASKYQQEPSSGIDATIKPEWWQYYDNPQTVWPETGVRIVTADTAYKSGDQNDESVLQLWGFSRDGAKAFLLDMENGRWEFPELINRAKLFFKRHNMFIGNRLPEGFFIEDKASGPPLAQVLLQEGIPTKLWNPPSGEAKDKLGRVLYAVRYIANSRVYLPRNAKFLTKFVKQCTAFNLEKGAHDDIVDAMTMALLIWSNFGARM
jgi:predicted phage terminase large subunit-like protein